MKKIKFSIITCTWNSARYLADTIASVISQKWDEIEYIFVDGGSTDETLEMIRSVRADVKLIENIRGGISRAMNVGIMAASGDVIAHLHSDDYYAHDNVLNQVAGVLCNTGAEWLFGRCLSDINGKLVPEAYKIPRYSYRRLLKGNFIPHPATFIRKSLLMRVGVFDEDIKYAMDYDLWLRLGKIADPIQLDDHLAVFRRHSGSASTANRMAALEEDYWVRKRYLGHWPWYLAYHWAHYVVRRRRLARMIEH
jgi:glycosyltransferase involved in cell wall biosynthesis